MKRETAYRACEVAAILLIAAGVATFSLGAALVVAGALMLAWLVLSVE